MAAEHARQTNKIRTDINADRPPSGKPTTKKKKIKIEAKLKTQHTDEEEDISEKPSVGSSRDSSRSLSQHDTPRSGPTIDHHIKYTENEKLKKWLKEKDKLYRQQVKEEKRKKRKEREKLIDEANVKLERRIKSQKAVKRWMNEKDKELRKMHKEQDDRNEKELERIKKQELNLSEALKIRPQSAPSTGRSDDVTIDNNKLKGEKTPGYVKDQIHMKREILEENKQAKKAIQTDPHPPQTKFIYKRPVAGKIKLKMEVRGKSPVAKDKESPEKKEETEKEARMSYDDWLKKKRSDDEQKKSVRDAERRKELAKSDPELDRMIPDIAKKRIEDKLNSRKRVNTGIKKFDEKTNRSFGGGEFNGQIEDGHRNPYRLEGDTRANKQTKRPSTAPASRGRVPHPTQSAGSPRKAVIPQKIDKVMANNDQSNPYTVPFPPEQGVPQHVASRQRKIFADRVTENLNEIEQRALLNSELIKEGLEAYTEGYDVSQKTHEQNQEAEQEEKRANISEMMYSPRKREDSSESSEEDLKPVEDQAEEKVTNILDNDDQVTVVSGTKVKNNDEMNKTEQQMAAQSDNAKSDVSDKSKSVNGTEIKNGGLNSTGTQETDEKPTEAVEKSMYRSFDNLNELTITNDKHQENSINLGSVNESHLDPKSVNDIDPREGIINDTIYQSETDEDTPKSTDASNIKVVTDTENSPSLVSILKESKKMEDIPVPESSGEPVHSGQDKQEEEFDLPSEEFLNPNRKRVSFNEKTEVFQSFESATSSSTDTVTPEPTEFDADMESLEQYPDDIEGVDKEEKMTFNIAGIEISPVILNSNGRTDDETKAEEETSTFITNPDESTA